MKHLRIIVSGTIALVMSVAVLWAFAADNSEATVEGITQRVTGHEDHHISVEEASELTHNFRASAGEGAVIGGYFGNEALLRVMSQENCVAVRFYYGLTAEGKPAMVLVGVDPSGADLVYGELAERNVLCPPFCAEENELNSSTIARLAAR